MRVKHLGRACVPSEQLQLIIFDCDGVLVDSEPITLRVFAQMLQGIGLPLTIDYLFEHFVGRSMQHCWHEIGRMLGHDVPDAFRAEFQRRSLSALREQVKAIAGVEAVLDCLPVACCVASSGGHQKMMTTLGVTGLLTRFRDRLFSATEVANGKPSPDIFLYAAAKCGVEPVRCAVIEDSPAGVRAGVTAGMRVYGYSARTPAQLLRAAGATDTFSDMARLPELLFGQEVSIDAKNRLD